MLPGEDIPGRYQCQGINSRKPFTAKHLVSMFTVIIITK
jgi:hypothetical protein